MIPFLFVRHKSCDNVMRFEVAGMVIVVWLVIVFHAQLSLHADAQEQGNLYHWSTAMGDDLVMVCFQLGEERGKN